MAWIPGTRRKAVTTLGWPPLRGPLLKNSHPRLDAFDDYGIVGNLQAMVRRLIDVDQADLVGGMHQLIFHVPGEIAQVEKRKSPKLSRNPRLRALSLGSGLAAHVRRRSELAAAWGESAITSPLGEA